MRLIIFVLSLSLSTSIFAWKMNMFADMGYPATAGQMTGGTEASDDMMSRAMQIIAGTPDGQATIETLNTDIVINGDTLSMKNGALDPKAVEAIIQDQMTGVGGSGTSMGSGFTRPKDFSARFVKARE